MRGAGLVIAAVLSAAAGSARADNALRPERIPNKARQLAERGRKHHNSGDYAAAVAAFKEAYVLAPSPGLLFNIAQAYRLAGNCDESAWMYRRFLDTDPKGTHRQLAETHLAVVEKCGTGGLRITLTPPRVESPLPQPRGRRSSRTTATDSLDDMSVTSSSSTRGSKLKTSGMYTLAGGGVALVGAALFALDARDASSTVENTYKRGGKWEDVADDNSRGQRSATIATVLGVGGGVAVLSGAVMYGLGRKYEKARHVAVTPTGSGAQVSLSWGF